MKVKALIEHLQAAGDDSDVLIHDASTDDDLPVGKVAMTYGQPVVLHAEGDDDPGGER